MKKENKKIEKLCSFYVSNWHLVTMLLPYINEKIETNTKIITILENNIEENIKKLLERLNLKNEEKILKINWKNFNSQKYEEVSEYLSEQNKNLKNIIINDKNSKNVITNNKKAKDVIILVNGSKENIEMNNQNIQKWLKKEKINKAKIINFFEVTEFNNKISEILDNHDKVFNTSGEREISEVFEGYEKKEKVVGEN